MKSVERRNKMQWRYYKWWPGLARISRASFELIIFRGPRGRKQVGLLPCFLESRAVTCMFLSTNALELFAFQLFSRECLKMNPDLKDHLYIQLGSLRPKPTIAIFGAKICQICAVLAEFLEYFVTCERSTVLANQETLRSYLIAGQLSN